MAKKKGEKIQITDETVFQRNEEDFLCTEVDGETVIMNTINGGYWGFNPTLTDIWNMLEKDSSYKEITDQLLAEYDVEEETCKKDTLQALVGMLRLRAVSIKDPQPV